jgi:serine/threonine protein phosphatase PrpC
MMLKAGRFAAAQIVGDRDRQEDDFAILDLGDDHHERLMLVLADGMGGHAAAAQAAHCAVQHFCQIAQASDGPLAERLQPALIGANAALALSAAGDPAFAGAGCTFLAAAIEDGTLSWISVGDSLLFSLRGRKLRLLNKERSRRQIVVRGMTRRKYLRSSLTGESMGIVDRSPSLLSLRPGEQLILASDGLETLHRPVIAATLKRTEPLDVQASVDFLLREVHQRCARNQDNTTVILYRRHGLARRDPQASRARTLGCFGFLALWRRNRSKPKLPFLRVRPKPYSERSISQLVFSV